MNYIYVSVILTTTLLCFNCIHSQRSVKTINTCGQRLADMLADICGGVYNPPKYKKMVVKSNPAYIKEDFTRKYDEYLSMMNEEFKQDLSESRQKSAYPYKHRKDAYELSKYRFRRQSGGIVDECCLKSCSIDEITGYCG